MFKNKNNQVRSAWLIAFAFLMMFVAQGIFTLPGMISLMTVDVGQNEAEFTVDLFSAFETKPWLALLTQGGGTIGGILATILVWMFINKRTVAELGFRGSIADFFFGLFLGAISITCMFLFLLLTGQVELLSPLSQPNFSIQLVTFLILFVLVGFFEEMFFRGYVMQTMASRNNQKWIIYVVSALIFSIVHGWNPNVSFFGLLNIALVGLLFAYMFDATKSLWLPIGYHITWNYFQGNVFGFAVSGIRPNGLYQVDVSKGNDWLTGGNFGLEGGWLTSIIIILGFLVTHYYVTFQKTHQTIQE